MSDSYRKVPIFGNGARSEKKDKKIWHRKFRKNEKMRLKRDKENYEEKDYREYSDPWVMSKDGKHWWDEDSMDDLGGIKKNMSK